MVDIHIVFIDENGGGRGVRLRKRQQKKILSWLGTLDSYNRAERLESAAITAPPFSPRGQSARCLARSLGRSKLSAKRVEAACDRAAN
jgi:hypothetical protein